MYQDINHKTWRHLKGINHYSMRHLKGINRKVSAHLEGHLSEHKYQVLDTFRET